MAHLPCAAHVGHKSLLSKAATGAGAGGEGGAGAGAEGVLGVDTVVADALLSVGL